MEEAYTHLNATENQLNLNALTIVSIQPTGSVDAEARIIHTSVTLAPTLYSQALYLWMLRQGQFVPWWSLSVLCTPKQLLNGCCGEEIRTAVTNNYRMQRDSSLFIDSMGKVAKLKPQWATSMAILGKNITTYWYCFQGTKLGLF